MVTRLLGSVILLITMMPVWAVDQLSASVDKNPVLVGEYFTLTIEANGKVSGQMPDTSALSAQFVTSPISTSSRTSIINGSMSSTTSWQMQLLSRKAGEFTIPSFEVAGHQSRPIELKVLAREQDGEAQQNIFIKTELKPDTLHVQQAALYTVKLYVGQDLLDGQLSAPQMQDAQIAQLGKQSEDYEIVNGRRYMVVTREYLVQPQKSGTFTLEPPIFNGQIREGYRRMAVSAMGDGIEVEVQPIPSDYSGTWLPSELVNLSEEWQPSDQTVMVGTPITRTLTLTALGVTKEQLPDIQVPDVNGFRTYPDETDRKQMTRDGRVISQLIASYALLPQTPGTYTLPEIKVPWFNTVINKVQYATLPSKTIEVKADPNQVSVAPAPVITAPQQTGPQAEPQIVIRAEDKTWLNWALIASGYVLWLITLAIWFVTRQSSQAKPAAPEQTSTTPDEEQALKQLKRAANASDTAACYQALKALARAQGYAQLAAWRHQLSQELQNEIAKLQGALYSANQESVDLSLLYRLLATQHKQVKSAKKQNLEPLY
ncbi:BatD family protein [Pseudoalteromonas sp. OOF1S-7]|uniref:BatD family protein n=1 Tax=Pseudoalteromonas sp. OOF1S-7 TaxID=2917757 RepID=UPI001EF60D54|nr:BatD family protein [Pseudoalteromonas sp. OOF1S-7]MCG7533613.1 BatD family protein [Pseudoalteromonas sp. OOF1S-7]